MRVLPAGPDNIETARGLFREYANWLQEDLYFQGFEEELAGLPGKYAPPGGALLLGWEADEAIGCVAMRPLETGVVEMKRLYVKPQWQGGGRGRQLAQTILAAGRTQGYRLMRLDTLEKMGTALNLYESLGFYPIPAYYHNPIEGTVYLECQLTD